MLYFKDRLEEQEMLKTFFPLNDWVVVKKWQTIAKSEEGLFVPRDMNNYQCNRGTVVKIGPCKNLEGPKPLFKVGDEVLFSPLAGLEHPMPLDYLIIPAASMLAVLEPDVKPKTKSK